MKNIHVTFALTLASVTWADPKMTYAFFASFNTTLVPLHLSDPMMRIKYFTWGDLSAKASEFFYENGTARSSNPLKPGYANINLCSTLNVDLRQDFSGSDLKFSEHMRLTNTLFYSCPDSKFSNIIHNEGNSNCFLVDIYFLPYNKMSNAPMEGSYTAKEKLDLIPHVFFVEHKKAIFEPLYSESFEPSLLAIVPFNHGNQERKPIELYFQDDHAITVPDVRYSGPVGSTAGDFGYGGCARDIDLGLTRNMKLSTRRFFSCRDVRYSDRLIVSNPHVRTDRLMFSNTTARTDCFEVNMYLLPYNRTSGRPMEGSYVHQKEDELLYGYFKVNANGIMRSLYYHTKIDLNSGREYGIFHFSIWQGSGTAMFSLKNKITYTRNTPMSGFAGFSDNRFVFGGNTLQTPIEFDSDMKILGHHFYLCPKEKNSYIRELIVDARPSDSCFDIEVYFITMAKMWHYGK